MGENPTGGDLLTYRELADKLGYAHSTVKKKMSNGDLPFTKVRVSPNAAPRVRESEVDAWISQKVAEAQASDSEAA